MRTASWRRASSSAPGGRRSNFRARRGTRGRTGGTTGDFHNKTANLILFASTSIDPVTPLANAFLMAKGFEGSRRAASGQRGA